MNVRRRSFAFLLLVLFLLFVPTIIELLGGPKPSTDLNQIIGFALTLIGVFGGAYFELDRFERQLKEDRLKEIRQHRLTMLDHINRWTSDIAASVEDISVLRELSPRDPEDDSLIIGRDKIRPIAERLLRLDHQWLTILAKTVDAIGFNKDEGRKLDDYKDEQQALLVNIYVLGRDLTETREVLAKGNRIPDISQYNRPITEVRRAIDKIRMSID